MYYCQNCSRAEVEKQGSVCAECAALLRRTALEEKTHMTYRFVGTTSSIEGIANLREFGQRAEIPKGMEREAAKANCIPEEVFAEIGFTDDELSRYRFPGTHADAPPEFQEKKKQALTALHDLRGGE